MSTLSRESTTIQNFYLTATIDHDGLFKPHEDVRNNELCVFLETITLVLC